MGAIYNFIIKNKLITCFFAISIGVIVVYILSIDSLELFDGAENWFNLLFQLSVGYIINFMFYVTQVYIPSCKRSSMVHACIAKRVSLLIHHMDESLSYLANIYIKNHKGTIYTKNDLDQMLSKLCFSDIVNVVDVRKTQGTKFVYFNVRDWIANCISKTEQDIDNLFKYYTSDISVELMEILEKITSSTYHSVMHTLVVSPNDVDFSGAVSIPNGNFFLEYYDLIQELKQIQNQ